MNADFDAESVVNASGNRDCLMEEVNLQESAPEHEGCSRGMFPCGLRMQFNP